MGDPEPQGFRSWAEMVEGYRRTKLQDPWRDGGFRPQSRVTHFEKSRESRVFNPVLQRFNDEQLEARSRSAEHAAAIQTMNRARERELRFTQRFDVVTLAPKVPPSGGASPREKRRVPDTRTAHDLITHADNASKPWMAHVPPGYFETSLGAAGKRSLSQRTAREYDVISNRYHVAHQQRTQLDEQATREALYRKYWQNRVFDPVTGRYVDPAQERTVQAKEEEVKRTWGKDRTDRLPSAIQRSEGAAYDVVTMRVRSPQRMDAFCRDHDRSAISPLRYAVEPRLKQQGDADQGARAERGLKRVAAARFKGGLHGFDIVTNEPTQGRGARKVYPAYPAPPAQPWERLTLRTEDARTAEA